MVSDPRIRSHTLLIEPVDELCKSIRDTTDIMQAVAEKTTDMSGYLPCSSDNSGLVNTNAKWGPGAGKSNSTDVVGIPWTGAETSETLPYLESRGGVVQHPISLVLNAMATVRELDERCAELRNNLSLGSSILDQQQKTIVSGTFHLTHGVALKTTRRV